jgi:DNA-binding ferritin-like protein
MANDLTTQLTAVTAQMQQFPEFFKKFVDDQASRFQALSAEASKLESKVLENASLVVDETAKMVKESLAHAVNLNAEYRRLSLEAVKKAASFWTPRA